jgi:methylglutaconyl-CoA hydratase
MPVLPSSPVLDASLDENNVARLTMNRPDRHNAFNADLIAALHTAFTAIADMPAVRAVVLRGEGRSFSAGADLDYMKAAGGWTDEENRQDGMRLSDMLQSISGCPAPVIAVAKGGIYGGGVGLIACAHMAVAIDGATFRLSEVRLGLTPATISPFVISALGPRRSRQLFMSAEPFGAAEARAWGLVHAAVTDEKSADAQVAKWVDLILEAAPNAVTAARQLVDDYAGHELTADLRADSARRIAERRASAEGREGLSAFLEKRKPNWIPDA